MLKEKMVVKGHNDTNHTIEVEHDDNFISIYKNVFPENYCQHMIKEFERIKDMGVGGPRPELRHEKADYSIAVVPGVHILDYFLDRCPLKGFFDRLQVVYENYSARYSTLREVNISTTSCKMQRTDPCEGYHIWHHETGGQRSCYLTQNRAVVYSLYLNTLDLPDEGGETEFLYQKRRIPPVENTMILWPASYTHVHRGNAVLGSRSKYIITGWFYYAG